MKRGPRNFIGSVTSILWIAVGAFILAGAETTTWIVAGIVVLALGLLRAVLLLATWRAGAKSEDEQRD